MATADEPIVGYTFYTRSETAALLGVTTRQIERLVGRGVLGYVRIGGRTLHTPEQIAAFVRASTVEAAS